MTYDEYKEASLAKQLFPKPEAAFYGDESLLDYVIMLLDMIPARPPGVPSDSP
jgi:hypothetical protein